MEIRSILVNLDVDAFAPHVVQIAADIARKHGAHLIGVAAAAPYPPFAGIESTPALSGWYGEERTGIEKRLVELQDSFNGLVPSDLTRDWVPFVDAPTLSVAAMARRADLIVTCTHAHATGYERRIDVGELVLSAGRPVLVAAEGATQLLAERIVVGWKNTREARRAIVDALPFLRRAAEVRVVGVTEGDLDGEKDTLRDVLAWLDRHQVKAQGDVYPEKGSTAATLEQARSDFGADLVVSGGYGHSRVREWLFGGVTRELLANHGVNRLMSN